MSYCRWSSDDFQCDLYCYEDAGGGWTTHVAGNRVVGPVPHVDYSLLTEVVRVEGKVAVDDPSITEFTRQHNAQHDWLLSCEREEIDHPEAGETFSDPTLEAFRDRLLYLRSEGFKFPDYVLDEIEAEIKERDGEGVGGGSGGPA